MAPYIFRPLFIAVLFLAATLSAKETLLKESDISSVMQKLLKQHVDIKEMTPRLIRNSLQNYIDQFDWYRLYLLEQEARPFIDPSPHEIEVMLQQYQEGDLSIYERLNHVIKNAVLRARKYRETLLRDPTKAFALAISKDNIFDMHKTFARDEMELDSRIFNDAVLFIRSQLVKLSVAPLKYDKKKLLSLYNQTMEETENSYLGVNESGQPLSFEEQQNLFAMHVLKALASSLDSHTKVMNPNEAYEMKIRLNKEYEGIGINLEQKNQHIVITEILKDSPADKSGQVKVNDRVIAVNGHNITTDSFDHALELIRNAPSPSITLELQRYVSESQQLREKTVTVTLQRAPIIVNEGRVDSTFEPYDDGIIGKITLHSFYQNPEGISSEKDIADAIKKLRDQGQLKGLILDLRDNMGGFLSQAVKVVGLFISNGIVVIAKYSDGKEHVFRDMNSDQIYDGPLVVLTSKETASAAEIVAQALQDYGVAFVVGDEHTYGKGTIQSQTVTSKDDATSFFKVTVGKYYTVSGRTPQLQGVRADIVVPSPLSRAPIGEKYLDNPVKPDQIPASYVDKFVDVDQSLRSWFLRYYAPTEQEKKLFWQKKLPELRKKSEERMASSPDFREYLKQIEQQQMSPTKDKDLQLEEATNILKDMISNQR